MNDNASNVAPAPQMPAGATVLVVGGTGFIGRHLAARCIQLGAEVTILARPERQRHWVGVASAAYGDLRQRESVARALEGRTFQFVFNLGGYVNHTPYFSGGRDVIDQHLIGLMNLIDALHRPTLQGFVHVGSGDEYGDRPAPQAGAPGSHAISPYAFAKRACADLIVALAKHEAFPGAVARLFLVYGPGQSTERFLPQIIGSCLRDERFPVSPGEQIRDLCLVDEVVDGLIQTAVTPAARGRALNIASGRPARIRDVVELVVRLAGGGRPQFGQRPYRPGESMSWFADLALTRELTGWQARTTLEDGLARTIAAYRAEAAGVGATGFRSLMEQA